MTWDIVAQPTESLILFWRMGLTVVVTSLFLLVIWIAIRLEVIDRHAEGNYRLIQVWARLWGSPESEIRTALMEELRRLSDRRR